MSHMDVPPADQSASRAARKAMGKSLRNFGSLEPE